MRTELTTIARGSPDPPLSEMLRTLCDGPRGPIRVREIVDHFGHRAFGAVLFVFSVPNLLPLPPGSSSILGLPLVLIAPQLAIGARRPWLPRSVGERTIERSALNQAFSKLIPSLERVETLLAPRLSFLFGAVGDRAIGLICFILSLVLILPIPLGNMLPAASTAAFSLGLTQKDGILALIGYLLAGCSFGVLALSIATVYAAVEQLLKFFGG